LGEVKAQDKVSDARGTREKFQSDVHERSLAFDTTKSTLGTGRQDRRRDKAVIDWQYAKLVTTKPALQQQPGQLKEQAEPDKLITSPSNSGSSNS
jgi:hypothetical protein